MVKLTTTSNLKRGVDLSRYFDSDFGPLNPADPAKATFTIGGNRIGLIGDYSTTKGGASLDGTVERIDVLVLGKPVVKLTGLALDAADLVETLGASTGRQVFTELFSGDDRLVGSGFRDILLGMAGDDTIRGGKGNDSVQGGTGADALYGDAGFDLLEGQGGNDTISGGFGDDVLLGGAGRDMLLGQGGDDRMDGGAGNDRLRGGAGADQFVFTGAHGKDVIGDMTAEDSLYLDASYFDGMANAAALLNAYATVKNGNAYIEFGQNSIQINGWTDLETLGERLHSADDLL